MRTAAVDVGIVIGALVGAFAIGATLYVVVTFVVMRLHTAPIGWGRTLRAALGEAIAVALTQPLLPLYYAVGSRMGGPREGRPIVFVHGYAQNRVSFLFLARAVRKARLGPLYGFNYDFRRSIATSASALGRFVEKVCLETGEPKVAIVAHSLGGLVALEYMAKPDGAARVDRCVTIASPHAGLRWPTRLVGGSASEVAEASAYMRANASRPIPLAALSIYSSHDNLVHPPATSELGARGGVDRVVAPVGHLAILLSREVAEATVKQLSE
jgi:triacylglycerol lipase